MGRGDLFRTDLDTIENCLTTPDAVLAVYVVEDFLLPSVSGINQKAVSLGKHGRP
jgi:hypothetical protein